MVMAIVIGVIGVAILIMVVLIWYQERALKREQAELWRNYHKLREQDPELADQILREYEREVERAVGYKWTR